MEWVVADVAPQILQGITQTLVKSLVMQLIQTRRN